MKILLLALAGGPPGHDKHQLAQESTWASNDNPNFRTIWIRGNPELQKPELVGNYLYLPVEETYENLLKKTILGIHWAVESVQFDFLIRTNTSNYFDEFLVLNKLLKYDPNDLIAGGVKAKWKGTIQEVKWFHPYISGAGIYLTRAATERLQGLPIEDYAGIPDDVAIGHYLKLLKVQFRSIARGNITDFKPIWPVPQTRVKSWSDENITSMRMHEVSRIYNVKPSSELANLIKEFALKEINRAKIESSKRSRLLKLKYGFLNKLIYFRFKYRKNF